MGGGVYCFGTFRLVVRERVLLKGGVPVRLGSRAFDLLLALVERAGETVTRGQLFKLVWPDVIVAKVNLRVHIAGLRKVLGDDRNGNRLILSIAGRGYRFIAPVTRVESAGVVAVSTRLERLFGDDAAIAALSSQLARRRVITLGGPGGWGRTSVAFAIAHTLVTDFEGSVLFVDLAGIDDADRVPMTVASALGHELPECQPLASLLRYLRDKEMLLVIDNCDHVIAGVAELTDRLLTEAPMVHVVISSRAALRLFQEEPAVANRG